MDVHRYYKHRWSHYIVALNTAHNASLQATTLHVQCNSLLIILRMHLSNLRWELNDCIYHCSMHRYVIHHQSSNHSSNQLCGIWWWADNLASTTPCSPTTLQHIHTWLTDNSLWWCIQHWCVYCTNWVQCALPTWSNCVKWLHNLADSYNVGNWTHWWIVHL